MIPPQEEFKVECKLADLSDCDLRITCKDGKLTILVSEPRRYNIMKNRVAIAGSLGRELDKMVEGLLSNLAKAEDEQADFLAK